MDRRRREVRMFAAAMQRRTRPVLAQIIPIRRCNLACTYCNEFDHSSQPVPLSEMLARVDKLAALGVSVITISGGEPLLHPQIEDIIRRIRSHGAIATLISNAYLLSPQRIHALNDVGLDYLQISIDNVEPDETSMKSLRVLERKLEWLAQEAEFSVTINSVLGVAVGNPEDALTVARRARSLGFNSTVGIAHDGAGQSQALPERQLRIYQEIRRLETGVFSFAHYDRFQENLVRGLPNAWHCHAGARFLYVCEDGLVHWCSQQRGHPGHPAQSTTRTRTSNGNTPSSKNARRSAASPVSSRRRCWTKSGRIRAECSSNSSSAAAPPTPTSESPLRCASSHGRSSTTPAPPHCRKLWSGGSVFNRTKKRTATHSGSVKLRRNRRSMRTLPATVDQAQHTTGGYSPEL